MVLKYGELRTLGIGQNLYGVQHNKGHGLGRRYNKNNEGTVAPPLEKVLSRIMRNGD